jgi:hypothetical protein
MDPCGIIDLLACREVPRSSGHERAVRSNLGPELFRQNRRSELGTFVSRVNNEKTDFKHYKFPSLGALTRTSIGTARHRMMRLKM